jgi:hypothetical protein
LKAVTQLAGWFAIQSWGGLELACNRRHGK